MLSEIFQSFSQTLPSNLNNNNNNGFLLISSHILHIYLYLSDTTLNHLTHLMSSEENKNFFYGAYKWEEYAFSNLFAVMFIIYVFLTIF